jgi:SAM-dependent methyltransferase
MHVSTRVEEAEKAEKWAWASEQLNRELAVVQSVLDETLEGRKLVQALDAGCGAHRNVRIPTGVRTVGIDISQRQLDRNLHLDERIRGDLQTYPLPEQSFDLIVCWDVLEHLANPEAALHRMQRALKPDGIMVLALPNLMSVKGLVTKFTPHGFHTWFYRHVYRSAKTGEDDEGPFPTYFRRAISADGIKRFAAATGLAMVHFGALESRWQRLARLRFRITGRIWKVVRFGVASVTFGRVDPEQTDLLVVLGGSDWRPSR